MTTNTPIISIKKLTKRYHKAKEMALRGIDLKIERGEFFGLLGPNGSGKTTTISILTGLLIASEGEVSICNKSIPHHISAIKPLIGLVPQEIALYSTLTVKENLYFFGKLYGLVGDLLEQRVEKYLDVTGLKSYAKQQINTFSGGMKRRANLAVSLLHEPEILFLDEPTVNVDPHSRHVIFEILKDLNEKGMTLIYTTHYLEEAEHLCQRVAIIDYGKVIAIDTPQNLIKKTPGSNNLGEVFLNLTGRELRD